jgi:hypothetical protein
MTSSGTTGEWIRILLSWLATYAVHSTLFLGGAWALCRWLPRCAPSTRERLWKLGLVGGLLSATLQLALGARPWLGQVEWAGAPEVSAQSAVPALDELPAPGAAAPASEPASPPVAATAAPAEGGPDGPAAPLSTALRGGPRDPEELAGTAPRAASPRPSAGREPGPTGPPRERPSRRDPRAAALRAWVGQAARAWPGFVLVSWCAAGLAGVVCLAGSWTCLRRRMLSRKRLRSGPLVEMLEELRRRAGLRTRVRLSVSPRIRSPFSTGILRPEICLPSAVPNDLSRAQQEALLAHELAHLRRRDPAWFGASTLIEKVFFFQPLNRLARAELSELAELACDDWAVRWTGGRLALASCLTEVAGWLLSEPRRALALPGLAGHRSRLGRRIQRLLDDRRSPASEPRAPWWPPLALTALGLAAFAAPGVSAGRPDVPESAPDPDRTEAPALPSPSTEPPAREPEAAGPIDAERAVLERELVELQAEIDELRSELAQRELDRRFAAALEQIDARMRELSAQHRRVRALLAELSLPNTLPHASTEPLEAGEER